MITFASDLSLWNVRLEIFARHTAFGNFRVLTSAWAPTLGPSPRECHSKLSSGCFRSGTFVREVLLGSFHFRYFGREHSLENLCLIAIDCSLGNVSLGSCALKLCY